MSAPPDAREPPPPLPPRRENSEVPPPPVPSKFSNGDINLLRYFALLRVCGPAATVFARSYVELTLVGGEGVLEFCRTSLGFSNARLRHLFTREEVDMLEGAWDPFTKDVSFLFKLLQIVCGLSPPSDEAWWEPSHRLEFLLRSVKNQRNAVAHSIFQVSDTQLETWTGNLLEDLRAILGHVAAHTGRDLHFDLQHLEASVQRILQSRLPPVLREELEGARRPSQCWREKQHSNFLAKCCTELRERYADFCTVPKLLWEVSGATPVEQVFVAPDVSSKHKSVLLGNLLPPHREFTRHVTVLQGSAGAGKTTLCRFLVSAWCRDPAKLLFLGDVDVVLLVRCASVRTSNLAVFLTEELLPQTMSDETYAKALPRLRDVRVLLVADGWDEADAAAKALLHHALAALPSARVLLTLRPEFALDLQLDLEIDAQFSCSWIWLRLQGLGATAREEYLHKSLNGCGASSEALLRDLRRAEHLALDMQRLPMTLALLAQLWGEDCAEVRGDVIRQRLFELILRAKTQRLVQRHVKNCATSSHRARAGIERWVQTLDAAAWKALEARSCVLPADDEVVLREVCTREGLEDVALLSALVGGYDAHANVWFFEHSLMQQFLAARFLVREGAVGGGLLRGRECSEARRILPTVTFAAAILCVEGRMDKQAASVIGELLGAPGIPWEAVGDVLLETRLHPLFCDATAALLASTPPIDAFSSSCSPALVSVLRHTALRLDEVLHVQIDSVPPEFRDVLTLIDERGARAICIVDAASELEAFARFLEKDTGTPDGYQSSPPFAMVPSLKLRLGSTSRTTALHTCLSASCGPRIALYLEATDEEEVRHICAFLRLPDSLVFCFATVNLPEDPWSGEGLASSVGYLLDACPWPATLFFTAPSALLKAFQKEVRAFRRRREDFLDFRVEYEQRIAFDDDYENIISTWMQFPEGKIDEKTENEEEEKDSSSSDREEGSELLFVSNLLHLRVSQGKPVDGGEGEEEEGSREKGHEKEREKKKVRFGSVKKLVKRVFGQKKS